MRYVGAITLAVLCAPAFAVYAGVSLDLALQLTALVAISASIAVSIPDLEAQIAAAVALTLGINVAVEIGLPSISADLGLSLNARLAIVLGLVAAVKALLTISGASLEAFTWVGAGSELGPALTTALADGWGDGTPANDNVTALVLAATSTGTYPLGELASLQLLGGGQAYERGLCSVSLSGSATATPTINPSTGSITGFTITSHGGGYVLPPTVTISDAVVFAAATNASPIVVSIADTTDVTAVTIAGVTGPAAEGLNGQWCAKVLTSSTIALYKDSAFTLPTSGSGVYNPATDGGMVTGNGSGAAAVPILGGGAIAQLQAFFSLFFGKGLQAAGTVTLAALCSVSFSLLAELLGELELEAKVLGGASLNFAVVPPTIGGNLAIVASIDATLKAALEFFPPLPSIQASLLATVNGRLTFIAALMAAIGAQLGASTEELLIFTYSGPGSGLGAAIDEAIGGGWPDTTPASSSADVIILGATTPAASAALNVFFPAAA
jgi:hypothetical protein